MSKRGVLMRALAALGLLLAIALTASPVMGASDKPLVMKNMRVSVWPEYDDPRVMVTYQGEFKDGSAFPQKVNLPVQTGSEVNMVCALKPPNDEHLCQLYDLAAGTSESTLSYTLPIPTYYLEYYWDGIKGTPDKSLSFKYTSPYAADYLELDVQQPLKATNFKLTQPYASVSSDSLGMKYYRYTYNNVAAGQTISIDATYTKADNTPSVKKKTNTSAASTGGSGDSNAYAITGIGAGLLALAGVAYILIKRKPAPAPARTSGPSRPLTRAQARRLEAQRGQNVQRQVARPQRPEPNRQTTPPPSRASGGGVPAVFCSQCGTKLAEGAVFCHACGAKAKGGG
ncbi:MAG: zinc ribbon domain-containing protein [Chloroflexi bacterium]|nr:zinc ribbon domain-containing protein [Chloroflexota bacterium]